MIKKIAVILLYFALSISIIGCQNKNNNINYSSNAVIIESTTCSVYTNNDDAESNSLTRKISSSEIKKIKSNTSYSEIIKQLGETQDFGNSCFRQYIVDDKNLFVLSFSNIQDICPYSGKELLSTIKPFKYQYDNFPKSKSDDLLSAYGIIVDFDKYTDTKFISIPDEFYNGMYLDLQDAVISFENGDSASIDDLNNMQDIIIYYDYIQETFPSVVHCLEVIIIN